MATKIGVVLALNDEEKFANGIKKVQIPHEMKQNLFLQPVSSHYAR